MHAVLSTRRSMLTCQVVLMVSWFSSIEWALFVRSWCFRQTSFTLHDSTLHASGGCTQLAVLCVRWRCFRQTRFTLHASGSCTQLSVEQACVCVVRCGLTVLREDTLHAPRFRRLNVSSLLQYNTLIQQSANLFSFGFSLWWFSIS